MVEQGPLLPLNTTGHGRRTERPVSTLAVNQMPSEFSSPGAGVGLLPKSMGGAVDGIAGYAADTKFDDLWFNVIGRSHKEYLADFAGVTAPISPITRTNPGGGFGGGLKGTPYYYSNSAGSNKGIVTGGTGGPGKSGASIATESAFAVKDGTLPQEGGATIRFVSET